MDDAYGNPDIMGSRPMSPEQFKRMDKLRLMFNAVHSELASDPGDTQEASRLFAVARTQLELSCMAAVKAISRG